jgi:hypothetical protein
MRIDSCRLNQLWPGVFLCRNAVPEVISQRTQAGTAFQSFFPGINMTLPPLQLNSGSFYAFRDVFALEKCTGYDTYITGIIKILLEHISNKMTKHIQFSYYQCWWLFQKNLERLSHFRLRTRSLHIIKCLTSFFLQNKTKASSYNTTPSLINFCTKRLWRST